MSKATEAVGRVSLGAWLMLCTLIAACAAIAIKAPPHMWEALAAADPVHLGGIVTLCVLPIVSLFLRATKPAKPKTRPVELDELELPEDDGDPTPRLGTRRDAAPIRGPGDPGYRAGGQPRRRDGSVAPPALFSLAAVAAILAACALLASGCSAVRVHATVASTAGATIDTWCQEERARREADMREAEAAHPIREDAAAAVAVVRASYEDELAACGVAKGLHDGWVEAITLGHAGAPFDAADVALRFVGPFAVVYRGLARATAGAEHPLPPPPEGLSDLAALATGGAR